MCTTTLWSRFVIGLLLLFMVSTLVPVVVSAQQTTPASEGVIVNKSEDLIGIWETQFGANGMKAYMQYTADGTFRLAYERENLRDFALLRGRIWFEGDIYFQKGEYLLAPEYPGQYTVRLHREDGLPDRLSFQVVDDASAERSRDLTAGMTRVELPGKIVNTATELVGIWETRFGISGAKAYLQYKADGTIRVAYARENLPESPLITSQFWFEGNVYCQKGEGDHLLTKGLPGKYEVRLYTEEGMPDRLLFQVIEDANTYRVKDLTAGMIRVEL